MVAEDVFVNCYNFQSFYLSQKDNFQGIFHNIGSESTQRATKRQS